MADTSIKLITYAELREGTPSAYDDRYGMLSDYLTHSVRETLLENPNLADDSAPVIKLILADNTIVGRHMLMPTRLKMGKDERVVQSGGSGEIWEECRGKGYGKLVIRKSILENDVYIGQLYSTSALSIIRGMGLTIFQLPCYYKLCKSRSFLAARGLKGGVLNIASTVLDGVIKLADCGNRKKIRKLKKEYIIRRETCVPEWVDEFTLNDGHIFAEKHDHKWLQWCLDYRFTSDPADSQAFFAIYDKAQNPKGFFMTKIRYSSEQGIYKNITKGTLVEWGSYDESELTEDAINLLAFDYLQPRVDNITTILSDPSLDGKMKQCGFLRHGDYQMAIKLGSLDEEAALQSNWRIRYGGCNTIIY